MKTFWLGFLAAVLTLCLLISTFPALGEAAAEGLPREEAARQSGVPTGYLDSLLTEVYGYTPEETEGFLYAAEKTDGEYLVRCWPQERPDWAYSAVYRLEEEGYVWQNGSSPFHTPGAPVPGAEAELRQALRSAKEAAVFSQWGPESGKTLAALTKEQTALSPDALEEDGLTAAQAVQALFLSAFGAEEGWAPAVSAWRDETLAANGLTLKRLSDRRGPGTRRRKAENRRWGAMEIVEFEGEFPQELLPALQAAGWEDRSCVAGVWVSGAKQRAGVAVLEQKNAPDGGRSLAIVLDVEGTPAFYAVGSRAVAGAGQDVYATFDVQENLFCLNYPLEENVTERFLLRPYMGGDEELPVPCCELRGYRRVNGETLEGIVLERHSGDGEGTNFSLTVYQPGEPSQTWKLNLPLSAFMEGIDADAFPRTLEQCLALEGSGAWLPEGYAVCQGVHLRQSASSRSKDLGTILSGTLVRVLEIVPGDPYPWARVQLGPLEGYMSAAYVSYEGSPCASPATDIDLLPVVEAIGDVSLKASRVPLFAATTGSVPAGTRMHVLAQYDGWYLVCAPRGELSWRMDVEGTFGFVRRAEVKRPT